MNIHQDDTEAFSGPFSWSSDILGPVRGNGVGIRRRVDTRSLMDGIDHQIQFIGESECSYMVEKKDVVTDERMEKYLDITARALAKIRIAAPDKSYNRRLADSFLEMANCYYADAKHFKECGDYVTAFAAVNYAHAWLDCGARIGLFDVDGDDVLFTLYE